MESRDLDCCGYDLGRTIPQPRSLTRGAGIGYGTGMIRISGRWLLIVLGVVLFAHTSPAPLIFRPGEGWVYEKPGGSGKWSRTRAKDQLDVAVAAFNQQDYSVAVKAGKRVVNVWPASDYAPQALYLVGRSYEAEKNDEKAFSTYRDLLQRYPKASNYEEVLQRQFEISNRFLAGQWFKLWGVIPFFPSMEKTARMYREVIERGPYSPVASTAQLSVGAAYEKLDRPETLPTAAQAYLATADRYHEQKGIAAEALYRAAMVYRRQAQKAEYDQSLATEAILTFTEFIGLHPDDPRVPEVQRMIAELKTEQARGALGIAEYYDKRRRREGALVYYNEAIVKAPNSTYAEVARERIAALKASMPPAPTPAAPDTVAPLKRDPAASPPASSAPAAPVPPAKDR